MKAIDIDNYELEISSDCNAECPLCRRTNLKMPLRGNNNILLADIKKIFTTENLIKGKEFKLCGVLGDPILNPECIEICQFLSDSGARKIALSTNGGYNTPEWWKKLGSIPNVQVDFSVDGFEETNHIYRVNVKWSTLVRNMQAYSETGARATWVFIPFAHNEHDYDNAKKLATQLGFRFIRRTSGRNELNNVKHKSKKMDKEVEITGSQKFQHSNINQVKEIIKNKDNKNYIDQIASTVKCKHLNSPELYIGADMTLWPCCFLYDEHSRKNQKRSQVIPDYIDSDFNSLKKYTISEILNNEFFKTLEQRWFASHPDHLFRCVKSCGKNATYMNKKIEDN